MAKIVINNTDSPKDSRPSINSNFTELYTGQEIVQATEKTTPVDADMVGLVDSAASNVLKKLSWTNIKATLKTWLTTDSTNILRDSLFYQALINGNFDVWQRGTSFAVNGSGYVADRWKYWNNMNATYSQQNGLGLNGSVNCIRLQRNSGQGGTYLAIGQALESQDSKKFRGQYLTLSFWARCGTNYSPSSSNLLVEIKADTTTDASAVNMSGTSYSTNVVLTTSWQKFTFTTTGAIASDRNQIAVVFSADVSGTAGANDYFEITQIQLNAGDTALPFQAKSFEEELQKCLRFYEKTFEYGTTPANNVSAGQLQFTMSGASYGRFTWFFKVPKRAVPSMTGYNPTAGTAGYINVWNNGSTYDVGGSNDAVNTSHYCTELNDPTTKSSRAYCYWQATADAEF